MKFLDNGMVECTNCGGIGYKRTSDNFIIVCPVCHGKPKMDWVEAIVTHPISEKEEDDLILKYLSG